MAGLMSAGGALSVYKVAENLSFYRTTKISLSEILPGYASYTNNDFVVSLKSGRSNNYGEMTGQVIWAGYSYPTINYSPDTGELTLTGNGPSIMYSGGVYNPGTSVVDVYAIKRIKNVST